MVRVATALLLISVVACGDSEGESQARTTTLRVAAPYGIGRFSPGFTLTGSSANALELGYDDFSEHASVLGRQGRSVRLKLHGPAGDQTLAKAFEMERVESVQVVEARVLEVLFMRESDAEIYVARPGLAGFALGPFRQAPGPPAKELLRLHRVSGAGASSIEFVAMGETEQWRRLLARDIAVVPVASPLHRRHYTGLEDLRVLEYQTASVILLLFNTERLSLGVRAAISGAIDKQALASALCEGCEPWPISTGPAPAEVPAALKFVVLQNSDVLAVTARALRLQLMEQGISVSLEYCSLEELSAHIERGDFDLSLMPRVVDKGWLEFVVAYSAPATRYRSPALDSAVAAADAAGVLAIVEEAVPLLPLLTYRPFAAVGAGWCGGEPRTSHNWKWLAELKECETP